MFNFLLAGLLVSSMILSGCKPDYPHNQYDDGSYQEGYAPQQPTYRDHGSNLGGDLLKVGAGVAAGKMWSDHQANKQRQQYGQQWRTPRNNWQRNDYGSFRPTRREYRSSRPMGNPISSTGWSSRPTRTFRSRVSSRRR